MNNQNNENRVGLWIKDSKAGNKYMNGTLKLDDKEYTIRIFKNTKKEKPNQPDYNMFYSLKENTTSNTVVNEDNQVHLTDEDFDKMLSQNESKIEVTDDMLPF